MAGLDASAQSLVFGGNAAGTYLSHRGKTIACWKGIDPILTPDLLVADGLDGARRRSGCGRRQPSSRAHRPARSVTGRLIRAAFGLQLPQVIGAILKVLPLDTSEPDPTRVMIIAGGVRTRRRRSTAPYSQADQPWLWTSP